MAKRIGKMSCPCCGASNDIYPEDLGFEEFECSTCECTFTVPEDSEDFDKVSRENRTALAEFDKASHVRIMARGEDGTEWCIKNMVSAENDLLDMALEGYKRSYPEATLWTEDEETTSPGFCRNAMLEFENPSLASYDEHY